jgi:tetratricopeptide (TPR) repeat protein/class 3 adenylate cyclase
MVNDYWHEYLEIGLEEIAKIINPVLEKTIALEEGENRLVSIFFLDIRGFTAMSEKLHSEQVKRIIDKVFVIFSNVITKNGGFINQYEGDKIMAFFGSKIKTETDTERAIKSGLDILSKLEQVNELFSKQEIELAVRIGINSGMVTTGKVGLKRERDFTVYGDAVNIASRLESNAPLNQILITKRTKKFVEDKFDFKFHELLRVKGKTEPLETYIVIGKKKCKVERWERKNLIHKPQYVGREKELIILRNTFEKAKTISNNPDYFPWIRGLCGEAGIGKSRLAYEFGKQVKNAICSEDENKIILTGYTNSYAQAPFFIWISLVKRYFDINETDLPETIKTKFEIGYAELSAELSHSENNNLYSSRGIIAALCGLTDYIDETMEPKNLQFSIQLALRYFLEAAAKYANNRNVPLIIVLEDLHWIDEASEQLFQTLLNTLNTEEKRDNKPAKKLFFILTYRQDYIIFSDIKLRSHFEEISLQPLNPFYFQEMIFSMLGEISLSDTLLHKLMLHSAGNPFYIEEWIHWLIELNFIVKSDGNWVVKDEMPAIPESLHSLILSRIDQLTEQQKIIMQIASVIGQTFYRSILEYLHKMLNSAITTDEVLIYLMDNDWLIKIKDVNNKDTIFKFKHAITCEVVYSTILLYNQKILHRLIAEYADNRFFNNPEYFAFLADHYEKAEMEEKTIEFILKAANHAKDNYQNEQSINLYNKLLSKYTDKLSINQMLDTLIKKAEVLTHIGKWKEAKEIFELSLQQIKFNKNDLLAMKVLGLLGYQNFLFGEYQTARICFQEKLDLAKSLDSAANLAEAYGYLGLVSMKECSYQQAENYFITKKQICEKINDWRGISSVLGNLGILYAQTGKYDLAKENFERKLELALKSNDKLESSVAYGYLGMVLKNKGEFEKALMNFEKRLKIAEELGDKKGITASYANIGIIYSMFSDYEKALQYYKKLETMELELGDKYGLAAVYGYLGVLYKNQSQYEKAMFYYHKQFKIMEEIADRKGISIVFGNLGKVYALQGNYSHAIKCYSEQLERSEKIHFIDGIALACGNLSWVNLILGNYAVSLEYIKKKLTIAEDLDSKLLLCSSYGLYGEILKEIGDYKAAKEFLQKQLILGQELFYKIEICDALRNLGDIYYFYEEYNKALELYQEQLDLANDMGDPNFKLSSIGNIGKVFLKQGKILAARKSFRTKWKISKLIQDKRQLGIVSGEIGYLLVRVNKIKKAKQYFNSFLQISQFIENKKDEAQAFFFLGITYLITREFAMALSCFEQALELSEETTPLSVKYKYYAIETMLMLHDYQKAQGLISSINEADLQKVSSDIKFTVQVAKMNINFCLNNNKEQQICELTKMIHLLEIFTSDWQQAILYLNLSKMSLSLNQITDSEFYRLKANHAYQNVDFHKLNFMTIQQLKEIKMQNTSKNL